MGKIIIKIGTVEEVENLFSNDNKNGMRVRVRIDEDKNTNIKNLPWAFPLLPKTLQVTPKQGEAVFVFSDEAGEFSTTQRYYMGPIISQPQFNTYCGATNATSLLQSSSVLPFLPLDSYPESAGAFPSNGDVAIVGRGSEDVILKYDDDNKTSEVDIRAGIRGSNTVKGLNDGTETPIIGKNVIFNGTDPAYIQLKYKKGIATGANRWANSLINIVANRVNIMSNLDSNIEHDLRDNKTLVKEVDTVMSRLHQVPKGDELVAFLDIVRGAILHHVHPHNSMEQAGDTPGYIDLLKNYKLNTILSDYVRIS